MSPTTTRPEDRLLLQLLDERRELVGALLREFETLDGLDADPGFYPSGERSAASEPETRGGLELRLLELRELHLQQTERALERLREGNYGLCQGCGETIGARRLEALPVANLCLRCQMARETVGMLGALSAPRP